MKIALLLRGLTYVPRGYIHHTGKMYNINYKNNMKNILNKVIIPLQSDNDLQVFVSTNKSEYMNEILDDFKPVKDSIFLENSTQKESLIEGLKLINSDYDFVIIIRFDLLLKKNVTDIPFEKNKFNFLWYEQTKDDRVADCMFFYDYKFHKDFIKSLKDCPHENSMHTIKTYIIKYIKEEDIYIVYNGYIDSNSDKEENPIYIINRGEILGDLSKSFYNKFLRGNKLKLLGIR